MCYWFSFFLEDSNLFISYLIFQPILRGAWGRYWYLENENVCVQVHTHTYTSHTLRGAEQNPDLLMHFHCFFPQGIHGAGTGGKAGSTYRVIYLQTCCGKLSFLQKDLPLTTGLTEEPLLLTEEPTWNLQIPHCKFELPKAVQQGMNQTLQLPTWHSESRERMPENKVTLQKTDSQLGHRYLTSRISVCVHAQWLQLCLTLCDRMDLSPPGFSVHGILQASILEWVAMPSVGEGKISLSLLADVIPKAFQCILALMPLALSDDSVRSLSRLSVFIKPPLPQSEGEFMLSPPPMVFRLAVQDSSCWAVRRWGFPNGSVDKESACNAGDVGLILGQEDPWEEEMANHSSILAWRIPWTEEPGGLQSMGRKELNTTE